MKHCWRVYLCGVVKDDVEITETSESVALTYDAFSHVSVSFPEPFDSVKVRLPWLAGLCIGAKSSIFTIQHTTNSSFSVEVLVSHAPYPRVWFVSTSYERPMASRAGK